MTIGSTKAAASYGSDSRDRKLGKLIPNPKAKLKDQFHEVARFKYFSARTEDSYWQWVVRYLRFHRQGRPVAAPAGLGAGVA